MSDERPAADETAPAGAGAPVPEPPVPEPPLPEPPAPGRPSPWGNLEETGEVPVVGAEHVPRAAIPDPAIPDPVPTDPVPATSAPTGRDGTDGRDDEPEPPGWSEGPGACEPSAAAAREQVPVPAGGDAPPPVAGGGVGPVPATAAEGPGPSAAPGGTEVLVITGMSGAGRSTVADRLEDLGWYVVDNLPPQMLGALAGLAARARRGLPRVAVVLDVRGQEFFTEVQSALGELRDRGVVVRVLFLEASDEALVRRFESVRRPHPLQSGGRILDGIRRERDLVAALRGGADLLVDTSTLNVHQLGARVAEDFGERGRPLLQLTVMSFGFKYGIPVDADHVSDVRFLPNPYWDPSLRAHTGREDVVRDFVLAQEGAGEWLERYAAALGPVVAGYRREHRGFATVAVGCTGGKHRSVALSEQLAVLLGGAEVTTRVVHRDLGRE